MKWSKFFWQDWDSDEGLRQCSLAAQGLWMRLLCICAKAEPYGYLAIAGQSLDEASIARAVGVSSSEVKTLMAELDQWGVFSRDSKGRIYSRRLVRDFKVSRQAMNNGLSGGNPTLCKTSTKVEGDNPPLNGGDKAPLKPRSQKPEAISQIELDQSGFDRFWEAYPRKEGKIPAKEKFDLALKKTTLEALLRALEAHKARWKERNDPQFIPHPRTWLNQERWLDEFATKSSPIPAEQWSAEDWRRFLGKPNSISAERAKNWWPVNGKNWPHGCPPEIYEEYYATKTAAP